MTLPSDHEIIRRIQRNLKHVINPRYANVRWYGVSKLTGLGRTLSCDLCIHTGFDPYERIDPVEDDEGEEDDE